MYFLILFGCTNENCNQPKKRHTHTHTNTHTALIVGGRTKREHRPHCAFWFDNTKYNYLCLPSKVVIISHRPFIRQQDTLFVFCCVRGRLRAGNQSEGYHTRIVLIRSKIWSPSAGLSITEANLLQFPIRIHG